MTAVKRTTASLCALSALILLTAFAPGTANAAPQIEVDTRHTPVDISAPHYPEVGLPLGARATYQPRVRNVGDKSLGFPFGNPFAPEEPPNTDPIVTSFFVPAGLEITRAASLVAGQPAWDCAVAVDARSASCTNFRLPPLFLGVPFPWGMNPNEEACGFAAATVGDLALCPPRFTIAAAPGTQVGDSFTVTVEGCGGGSPTCDTAEDEIRVVPAFEVIKADSGSFEGPVEPFPIDNNFDQIMEKSGAPVTQAGSHPPLTTTAFHLTPAGGADGTSTSSADQKDIIVDLPPGVLVNVEAIPTCTDDQLSSPTSGSTDCPPESAIGVVRAHFGSRFAAKFGQFRTISATLWNMEAQEGKYALFGTNLANTVLHLRAFLKRDPNAAGGYRANVSILNTPQTVALLGGSVSVEGVPIEGATPFLTLPTSCPEELRTDVLATTWQGLSDTISTVTHAVGDPQNPLGLEGCNTLAFNPSIEARPTTNVADSPSGLDVKIHVPQNQDPTETSTAHMRATTLTLPEGMVTNPASANGLVGCTPAQVELSGERPVRCPDASRLGTARVETPMLDHPLLGGIYLATPRENPFGSLLALYLALEDPITGTEIKVPGEVKLDPLTGQVTTTFPENPQVPFEELRLRFFGGSGGTLRTPPTCGNYTTTSSITPWSAPESGPPSTPQDSWTIEQGPQGGSCASSDTELPNTPTFDAGTVSPLAGQSSPMVVNLRREDGTQQFSSLKLTPPPGLLGKLAGIPYCPDSALSEAASKSGKEEQASPSCPAASQVGNVVAATGAGPAPYNAPGIAYLTGPYKGAPLSVAIVTPAVAGPFDLGTIVVRTALQIDPVSSQITALTDDIPEILQGIPLDIRHIQVRLERPDFTLNPTSCNPMAFTGELLSTFGQRVALESRFQLGECDRLGFKPKLSLSLKGGTKRGKHPTLTAALRTRPGDANLRSLSVAFPPAALLDQGNIDEVCTRVQFAASKCPPGSAYGNATVATPLVDGPLSGPVYLRSSKNPLPDLVLDLRGPATQPIKLEASGRTDTVKGGLRNTFEATPDAPFSKVTLKLFGGKKGLLQYSTNICRKTFHATVKAVAHNGSVAEMRPALRPAGCGKAKRDKRRSMRAAR